MIEWLDKSDRGSRFYVGEARSSEPLLAMNAVRSMFSFMCDKVLGKGNATEFDVLMFEVNCDTGRLISGASTDEGWEENRTDGCSIRVQEVQDYWYDLIDAGVAADDFSQSINAKVIEIARSFRELVVSTLGELHSKAGKRGFKFVVFGNTHGEAMLTEYFETSCGDVLDQRPFPTNAKENETPRDVAGKGGITDIGAGPWVLKGGCGRRRFAWVSLLHFEIPVGHARQLVISVGPFSSYGPFSS